MRRIVLCLALGLLLAGCQLMRDASGTAAATGGPVLGDAVTVTKLDDPPRPVPARSTVAPTPDTTTPDAATPVTGRPAPPPPARAVGTGTDAATDAARAEAAASGPAATEPPPRPKSAAQLACESSGGQWGKAGATFAMTCFKQTRDAGKSCRRESDCSTLCLARSRTCAPVTPLFGCHPVLQTDGREVTLCTD